MSLTSLVMGLTQLFLGYVRCLSGLLKVIAAHSLIGGRRHPEPICAHWLHAPSGDAKPPRPATMTAARESARLDETGIHMKMRDLLEL